MTTQELMNKYLDIQKEKILKFLTKAGLLVEREAKENFKVQTQYGTGTTAATIISVIEEEPDKIVCKVGSPSKVFVFREFGTSPHKSSTGSKEFVESVTKWGKRQGFTDEEINSIIFFIRKNGTRPKPALYPAYYGSLPRIKEMAKEMLL